MKRLFLVVATLLTITACSSAPPPAAEPPPAPPAPPAPTDTESCLNNPELSKPWGECNVKATLYRHASSLGRCRKLEPTASGSLQFDLRVKKDGRVRSVRVKGAVKKAAACFRRALMRVRFAAPPPGAEPKLSFPYQLDSN